MDTESAQTNPTLETIRTMRSVREFRPDPVEHEKLQTILEAAVMAPSSGNSQPWEFVVIRDTDVKRRIAKVISERWHTVMDSRMAAMPPKDIGLYESSTRLVDRTADVPVIILACLDFNRASRSEEARYASIYPAVQNLMLAAWSRGLGSCLTTHACSASRGETEVKEILGIPMTVKIAALIYLGYPARPQRPPTRIGIEKVVHNDAW